MARSRAVIVALVVAVLAGSSAAGWWLGRSAHGSASAVVVRALDGDTIEVRLVSGATDSSYAFQQSLQAAILAARKA